MGLHFDSSSSNTYVDHGSAAALDNMTNITVACWFRITEAVHDILVRVCDKSSTTGWHIALHNGAVWSSTTVRFLRNRPGGNAEARITNTISTNTWYFIVLTYNNTNGPKLFIGDESTLVVEGTYDTSSPTTGSGTPSTDAAGSFYVANRNGSPDSSNGLRGDIARIGVWDTEFSLAQIQRLQFAPLSVWAAEGTNLLACDYIHGTSGTQRDVGPGQNNGTITGTLSLQAHPHLGPLLVENIDQFEYDIPVSSVPYYYSIYRRRVA